MEGISLKYFDLSEFDSPDQPGSGEEMKAKFLRMLDAAREAAGVPFKITSGYRTREHNKKVGGVANSSHTHGCAADIACNINNRFQILTALLYVGFDRIGIADTFIHVDNDPTKNPCKIWTYGN